MNEEQPGGLVIVRKGGPARPAAGESEAHEAVAHPARLLRIANMTRQLLEEVRRTHLDEAGRVRMREIFQVALGEVRELLSEELQQELETLIPPLAEVPTESEALVAQAQLTGWLEGLFHGIEASLWAQHLTAQAQFEEMRRRALRAKELSAERESARRYM